MMRRLSTGLLVIGLLLLGYVGYQKLTVQQTLTTELAKAKDVVQAEGTSSTTAKSETKSKRSKEKTEDVLFQTGETVGYLEVPSLEMELPVLEGVDDATLAKGIGHHPETAFPGQGDRIFLAGHNDTTFSKISKLKKGDEVVLYLANGSYRYVMQSSEIVDYKDTRVLESTKQESLVVSTCYPFYNVTNSTERYLIYFEPVEGDAS
ncbi:class D sortase [Exiguobacterium acetylicum]|uniref:class D sortase n=1 Tax=Exiguobacterium acetylicum TaxID=41170 RepID=UPI001EE37EE8|nr:class D sortase [Exiguobacterium acetylicum]UKS55733.1 class D sortase [Exiguobacterium acetylicum]